MVPQQVHPRSTAYAELIHLRRPSRCRQPSRRFDVPRCHWQSCHQQSLDHVQQNDQQNVPFESHLQAVLLLASSAVAVLKNECLENENLEKEHLAVQHVEISSDLRLAAWQFHWTALPLVQPSFSRLTLAEVRLPSAAVCLAA